MQRLLPLNNSRQWWKGWPIVSASQRCSCWSDLCEISDERRMWRDECHKQNSNLDPKRTPPNPKDKVRWSIQTPCMNYIAILHIYAITLFLFKIFLPNVVGLRSILRRCVKYITLWVEGSKVRATLSSLKHFVFNIAVFIVSARFYNAITSYETLFKPHGM